MLDESPRYGPHGAAEEASVQDAVDIVWFSFPDDDTIVIEEWLRGTLTAVWRIPNNTVEEPPTADFSYRTEV